MRTTLFLPDPLFRKAKEISARRSMTLGAVVAEALRLMLESQPKAASKSRRPLRTFRGNGLRPGIDLHSSADLLDAMESR
jgi:hypothetical protein